MGLDHQATSAYHLESNAQAKTYNKTMIRYLNPKFYNKKKWRGSYEVIRKVGNLNLLVHTSLHSKPILVHIDRVLKALCGSLVGQVDWQWGGKLSSSSDACCFLRREG